MIKVLFAGIVLILGLAIAYPQDREIRIKKESNKRGEAIALVIGNGKYETSSLRNATNDASDIAKTLSELGFKVIQKYNLNQIEMKKAIQEFGEEISNGGVGLFYYAGHGVQVAGQNYLIPVGTLLTKEEEVEYEAVNVGFLFAQMINARNRLNIIILDACRSNPFERRFRSEIRGLARMAAPVGTIIAYATGPGSIASDGDERNGIYTQELLRYIRMPGLKIEEVFKKVRIEVEEKTQGKQVPWEESSLKEDYYFIPAKSSNVQPSVPIKSAQQYALDGNNYFNQKKWQEAEREYRRAVALEPTNPIWRNKVVQTLFYQGKFEEAEYELKYAIRLKPDDASLHYNLGILFGNQKQFEKAADEFKEAVRLDPGNPSYQETLKEIISASSTSTSKGNSTPPTELNTAPPHSSNSNNSESPSTVGAADSYIKKGDQLSNEKKWRAAELEYRKAVEVESNKAEWLNRLGYTLIQQKSWKEAQKIFERAVNLEPQVSTWHSNLGWALQWQEKWNEAEAQYREAIKLETNRAKWHGNLAGLFLMQENWEEAEREFRLAIDLDPNNYAYTESLREAINGKSTVIQSMHASARPVIDGKISDHEWDGAVTSKYKLGRGWLIVQNDRARLYIVIDVTEDTKDESGDYLNLSFDVDGDRKLTPSVDKLFSCSTKDGISFSFYMGLSMTTTSMVTSGKMKSGFGSSPNSPVPHRIWELEIPLDELRTNSRKDMRLGVRIHSDYPPIDNDTPASLANGFYRLIKIILN
jgi:uncharacterized caspase-like protein